MTALRCRPIPSWHPLYGFSFSEARRPDVFAEMDSGAQVVTYVWPARSRGKAPPSGSSPLQAPWPAGRIMSSCNAFQGAHLLRKSPSDHKYPPYQGLSTQKSPACSSLHLGMGLHANICFDL